MAGGHADQGQAAREAGARRWLLDAGAEFLPRAPWSHPGQPPSAVELIRFASWRSATGDFDEDGLVAALTLLPAARAEVDQLEAAVLFAARSRGLSWSRISQATGLGSAQAAQQRFDRISARVEGRGSA
jgi:hypothetical protein